MEIRDYMPGDESSIFKLFKAAYGKSLSEAYWKWRFIDNPENKVMIKLMWDKAELVGHYAVSPHKLMLGGKEIQAALSMTTMTHPNYAGRGIFKELANTLYKEEAKKSDLKAVWGFPNSNSHYGFIKNLKWLDLEQIPVFSIPIEKVRDSDKLEVQLGKTFSSGHLNTFQRTSSTFSIKVNKTEKYLTWRYLNNPLNKYDLFEMKRGEETFFAITKLFELKGKKEIDMVEFNFPAELESIEALLSAIKERYKSEKVIKINTWIPLNDSRHIMMEKIGFSNETPITYAGVCVLDKDCSSLADARNWYYCLGDSDVY